MTESGALIVGGRARRLGGAPKALITLEGEALLDRLSRLLRPRCATIFLVGDPAGPYAGRGLPIFADVIADRGAPGGVHAALCNAPPGFVWTLAGDLPRVDAALLDRLAAARGDHDVALFRAAGRLQPLVACWHTRARPRIEALLRAGRPGFAALIDAVDAMILDVDDESPFVNLNTADDLAAIGARLPVSE